MFTFNSLMKALLIAELNMHDLARQISCAFANLDNDAGNRLGREHIAISRRYVSLCEEYGFLIQNVRNN